LFKQPGTGRKNLGIGNGGQDVTLILIAVSLKPQIQKPTVLSPSQSEAAVPFPVQKTMRHSALTY